MVTKSKLFDIFDVIKDNDLSFCVLCLRNQNETKLMKPRALTIFMETFNYEFENPMICYMCEAKAESALKFISMVQFAVTIEKIMHKIFNHYHKYHNTKQKVLELLSDASRFKRTPFMSDVCDCEGMVDVIRERSRFRRTDTLTLHACAEHLDTGQQPAVCNSHNSPRQRMPDLTPVSVQRNLMDNIILFPASTNGRGPNLAHSNVVLHKNMLNPPAEPPSTTGRPTPDDGSPEGGHSKNLVVQRVIAGTDGVVYIQNEAESTKRPATRDDTNGLNVYTEGYLRKLLTEKMQNEARETMDQSKRRRAGSGTSYARRGGRKSDLRSREPAASLRSGEQIMSLWSGQSAVSLSGGELTVNLSGSEQTVNLSGSEQTVCSSGSQKTVRLSSGDRAVSLSSGKQAKNPRGSEQMPKEAVMDPKKVDWEDKIPMDLISFVEGADQGVGRPSLIYLPNYGRQVLPVVDPPFTACITDVRSERQDKQDSDDDLIVVNNVTPCIEID